MFEILVNSNSFEPYGYVMIRVPHEVKKRESHPNVNDDSGAFRLLCQRTWRQSGTISATFGQNSHWSGRFSHYKI